MITQTHLKSILEYDRETGIFIWKAGRRMRRVRPGDVAGSKRSDGTIMIPVNGRQIGAHRLAWIYVYGQTPTEQIIHVDHNRSNNAINNLAQRTVGQVGRLRRKQSNNKSGIVGVSWDNTFQRWDAAITINKRTIRLYSGPSFLQACRKRRHAEKHYNKDLGTRNN